ncbi:hypothetical protein D020_1529A, partial [Vibrio parahaemolyticus SBR10290]
MGLGISSEILGDDVLT